MTRRGRHRESILDRIPKQLHWRFNEQLMAIPLESAPLGASTRFYGIRIPRCLDRHWFLYLLRCVPAIPVAIGAYFLIRWQLSLPWGLASSPLVSIAVIFGLLSITNIILDPFRGRATIADWRVWHAMNRIGIRTCERCGYDCRGIEAAICPECGGSLNDAAPYAPDEATP